MSRPRSPVTGGRWPAAGSTWRPTPPRGSRRVRSARATCSRWPGSPGSRPPSRRRTCSRCATRSWSGAVLVNFRLEDTYVEVEANVDTVDRTGVEMEALTAAAVAALTIYDMCKSVDRSMTIGDLSLVGEDRRAFGHVAASRRRERSVRTLITGTLTPRPGRSADLGPVGIARLAKAVRELDARTIVRRSTKGSSRIVTVIRQTEAVERS